MNKQFLKLISFGCLMIFFLSSITAQECMHHDKSKLIHQKVATIQNNQIVLEKDTKLVNSTVIKDIQRAFRTLKGGKIVISNMDVQFHNIGAWYLYAEVQTDDQQVVFYRRTLIREGKEFILLESGTGNICLVNGCKQVKFTNDRNGCECVEPNVSNDRVNIEHRVFEYLN